MAGAVAIRGLKELQRDLKKIASEVGPELAAELRVVAEPVRADAATLARANISNIGPKWSEMRVGVTPGLVYVAPKKRRGRGSPRPNLGGLLMTQMEAALDANEGKIVDRIEFLLDHLGQANGF
jgi:hypothetical protein